MGEVAFGRPSLIADSYRRPIAADQNSCKGGTTITRSVGDSRCWGLEMFTFPAPNGALHTSWACLDKTDDDAHVPSFPTGHRITAGSAAIKQTMMFEFPVPQRGTAYQPRAKLWERVTPLLAF